jgi:bisphosphoglycerate-dependent phosphoglycerate mutase
MAGKLILCRHGQSDWNLKNLFTITISMSRTHPY